MLPRLKPAVGKCLNTSITVNSDVYILMHCENADQERSLHLHIYTSPYHSLPLFCPNWYPHWSGMEILQMSHLFDLEKTLQASAFILACNLN